MLGDVNILVIRGEMFDHAIISRNNSVHIHRLHCQDGRDQLVNLYANRVRLSLASTVQPFSQEGSYFQKYSQPKI